MSGCINCLLCRSLHRYLSDICRVPGGSRNKGRGCGLTRKLYRVLVILLAVFCAYVCVHVVTSSCIYLTYHTTSTFLSPRFAHPCPSAPLKLASKTTPSVSTLLTLKLVLNKRPNASTRSSVQTLKEAIAKGSTLPLLTLFSTWSLRPELSLVREMTLKNWFQLKPFVIPVLFTNNKQLAQQAQQNGWHTRNVSRKAVGVPVLKHMYLDVMERFNSALYAFSNGDILFTESLVESLVTILADRSLPLANKPLFVIGRRINVHFSNFLPAKTLTFDTITKIAKEKGVANFSWGIDFFVTDRRFPWNSVPEVVVGRITYDNWLVLYAIATHHVVVDVSNTTVAVHQTTRAGNFEGSKHANATYNLKVLHAVYRRIHYEGGRADCAPWQTLWSLEGKLYVNRKQGRPRHCRPKARKPLNSTITTPRLNHR